MSTYTDFTDALAEQRISGLQQLQDVQSAAVAQAVRNAAAFLPDNDTTYNDQLAEQREIVEANYRLGTRLLNAQRDYLLSLVHAAQPAPSSSVKSATVETTVTTEQ